MVKLILLISPQGRYSLEETKAPEGYRLTNKKWQVTVLSDGSVRIRETSITGESKLYTESKINIPVPNKPVGQKFRVYKKDGKATNHFLEQNSR